MTSHMNTSNTDTNTSGIPPSVNSKPSSAISNNDYQPVFEQHTPSNPQTPPSKVKLIYDVLMLIAISIDLLIITLDIVLMSTTLTHLGQSLGAGDWIHYYQNHIHEPLRAAGEVFTLFLIAELIIRWIMAVSQNRYYRWFFFPFVHWYEVLGCLPQLRALRLLRAVVIGRNLHRMGYKIVPQSWIDSGKFYYDVVLEELSDRVILTAIGNIRQQLSNPTTSKTLVKNTIAKNRSEIEAAIADVLKQTLTPYLATDFSSNLSSSLSSNVATNSHAKKSISNHSSLHTQKNTPALAQMLATEVGAAVQNGLANTPELHKYLKLIPIAGSLIADQLLHIGQHVGENVVLSLNDRLLEPESLDKVCQQIAHGMVNIDIDNPALDTLLTSIIDDALTALEKQVKIQQWKHQEHFKV